MRNWKKVISLFLAISLSVGAFAGCGDEENSSPNSGTGQSGSSTQNGGGSQGGNEGNHEDALKEEIFGIVKEAFLATIAYDGAFTRKASVSYDGEEAEIDVISVDPENRKMYSKELSGIKEKVYANGESYVSYYTDRTGFERFIEGDGAWIDESLGRNNTLRGELDVNYVYFDEVARTDMFDFDSIIDWENKMGAWIEASAETIAKETDNEDGDWYGYSDATANVDVACQANEDGSYSLTLKEEVTLSYVEEGFWDGKDDDLEWVSDYKEEMEMQSTSVITVKDGKMIAHSYTGQEKWTYVESAEDESGEPTVEVEEEEYSFAIEQEISYAFDQGGYDAFEVETPAVIELKGKATNKSFTRTAKVFVGNSFFEVEGVGESKATALGDALVGVCGKFNTNSWMFDGIAPVSAVSFTFYKDEACTQPIELPLPIVTMDNGVERYEYIDNYAVELEETEYDAFDTLYVKATVSSDYAFINATKTYVYAENVSEAYLPFAEHDTSNGGRGGMILVSENFNPDDHYYGLYGCVKAYYNDVEITEPMQLEGGKVYDIVYVCTTLEEELNFFYGFA